MYSISSRSAPIVITVIIVILLSVAAGLVFVKKYVCGGRLVYFINQTLLSHFPKILIVSALGIYIFPQMALINQRCKCALQVPGSQVLGAPAEC